MESKFNSKSPQVLWPKRTTKRERMNSYAKTGLTKLQELPPPVRGAFWLVLLVLAASVMGCATTSMPSSEPARIPSPPPTRLSDSPPGYLEHALTDISLWRKKLQELIPRQENSEPPGPSKELPKGRGA